MLWTVGRVAGRRARGALLPCPRVSRPGARRPARVGTASVLALLAPAWPGACPYAGRRHGHAPAILRSSATLRTRSYRTDMVTQGRLGYSPTVSSVRQEYASPMIRLCDGSVNSVGYVRDHTRHMPTGISRAAARNTGVPLQQSEPPPSKARYDRTCEGSVGPLPYAAAHAPDATHPATLDWLPRALIAGPHPSRDVTAPDFRHSAKRAQDFHGVRRGCSAEWLIRQVPR
jgi:hypothetical protein